jgi:hypothetical protein
MKQYNKFVIGLVVGAAAWLVIAASHQSDVTQPLKLGSFVQCKMQDDTHETYESGNVTSIAGKWVKLETQFANGGPKVVRWVNTDCVRTISFPPETTAATSDSPDAKELAALRAQLQQLLLTNTESSPVVQNVKRRIEALEKRQIAK